MPDVADSVCRRPAVLDVTTAAEGGRRACASSEAS